MSTIGVKYHDEDIHNIIRKPLSPTLKSPRYKSKRKISCFAERQKYNGHQTFGLAHYEAPETKNFLKKGKLQIATAAVKPIDREEFKCTINCKSSPIPKCTFEKSKKPNKNFVKENIKKVAALQPKIPVPKRVETPRGTVKDLGHLLQMIKIRESEEYGKIPDYLCERRIQWAKEKEKNEAEEEAIREYKRKMGIGTMGMSENVYMVDEETRQKLLKGLKENWNELSKQFLKLPVMVDTLPKIKRKEWLEKEIDQLEKDVRLVESHPYIYLERYDTRSLRDILTEELAAKKNEKKEEDEKLSQKESNKEEQDQAIEDEKLSQHAPEESLAEPTADKKEDEELKILNY